jgi:hypothetical protein
MVESKMMIIKISRKRCSKLKNLNSSRKLERILIEKVYQ